MTCSNCGCGFEALRKSTCMFDGPSCDMTLFREEGALAPIGDHGVMHETHMLPDTGREPLLPPGRRHLTQEVWLASQASGPDQGAREVEVNSVQCHPLVAEYQHGWDYWFR